MSFNTTCLVVSVYGTLQSLSSGGCGHEHLQYILQTTEQNMSKKEVALLMLVLFNWSRHKKSNFQIICGCYFYFKVTRDHILFHFFCYKRDSLLPRKPLEYFVIILSQSWCGKIDDEQIFFRPSFLCSEGDVQTAVITAACFEISNTHLQHW